MARKTVNLSLADSYKLMKLLEVEYTAKGMTDAQFAVYASEQLKFLVNADHVYNRRAQMGIPATRTATTETKKADKNALYEKVCVLELRIAALEKAVGK